MGLIRALTGAAGGVMADQWKEYIYCDALPETVLAKKAVKKTSSRSQNTKGEEDIITTGSVIAVAEGQCALIVEQGKVVDICAEAGEFTYDANTEPSLLSGGLNGANIKAVFANIGKRFTFGGGAPMTQRVYFINTKELIGNKYGTPSPVPFRVVDQRAGIDMDIAIKCFGEYSYTITNPLLFFQKICSSMPSEYKRENLDSQIKSELLTALGPAFARISEMGIRYSALPGHAMEMADALNDVLSDKWRDLRGIEVVSFGISSMTADEEDEKTIKEMQRRAAYTDPTMAAANLMGAQAQAMTDAANNAAGAVNGFMGMGMVNNMGYANAATNLYAMGQQQAAMAQPVSPAPAPASAAGWTCSCGQVNTGKFCSNCGSPAPAPAQWTCSCGQVNTGKFCSNCGTPRP